MSEPENWDKNQATAEREARTMNANKTYDTAIKNPNLVPGLEYALYLERLHDLADHITGTGCDVVVLLELLTAPKGGTYRRISRWNSEWRPFLYVITTQIKEHFNDKVEGSILNSMINAQKSIHELVSTQANLSRNGNNFAKKSIDLTARFMSNAETFIQNNPTSTYHEVMTKLAENYLQILNAEKKNSGKDTADDSDEVITNEMEIDWVEIGEIEKQEKKIWEKFLMSSNIPEDDPELDGDESSDPSYATDDDESGISGDEGASSTASSSSSTPRKKTNLPNGLFGGAHNDHDLHDALDWVFSLIKTQDRGSRVDRDASSSSSSPAVAIPIASSNQPSDTSEATTYPGTQHAYAILPDLNKFLRKKEWSDVKIDQTAGSKDRETIGVTIRNNSPWSVSKIERSAEALIENERYPHLIDLKLKTSEFNILIVCAHAPAPERAKKSPDWYKKLNNLAKAKSNQYKAVMLAADMNTGSDEPNNCWAHAYDDWLPKDTIHMKECTSFKNANNGVADIYNEPYDKVLILPSSKNECYLYKKELIKDSYSSTEGGRRYSDHSFVWREFLFITEADRNQPINSSTWECTRLSPHVCKLSNQNRPPEIPSASSSSSSKSDDDSCQESKRIKLDGSKRLDVKNGETNDRSNEPHNKKNVVTELTGSKSFGQFGQSSSASAAILPQPSAQPTVVASVPFTMDESE